MVAAPGVRGGGAGAVAAAPVKVKLRLDVEGPAAATTPIGAGAKRGWITAPREHKRDWIAQLGERN